MGSEPRQTRPAPSEAEDQQPETDEQTESAPDPVTEPGAHLRHHRSMRGFTLHQIATETKISVSILEQIEIEDFEALPAPAFVRGHVLQFARELRLSNADDLAKLYLRKMRGGDEEGV
jgi:hypothetical protein